MLEQLKMTSYDEVKDKKDIPTFVYNLYDKLKKADLADFCLGFSF